MAAVTKACHRAPAALRQIAGEGDGTEAFQKLLGPERAIPPHIAERAKRRCERAVVPDACKLEAIQRSYETASRTADVPRDSVGSTGLKPSRFAVVFYGLLPRRDKFATTNRESQLPSFQHAVLPALAEHVVLPLLRAGAGVDVFGHTWEELVEDNRSDDGPIDARLEEMVRLALARAALEFVKANGAPAVQSMGSVRVRATKWLGGASCLSAEERKRLPAFEPGAFCSAQAALRDVDEHSYAMVFMTRWDVVFYTPFEMHVLNPGLFYLAHWCRATGPRHLNQNARSLEPFTGCPDFLGAPDWFYVAAPATMRLFFDTFFDDLLQGKWHPPGFRDSGHDLVTCPGNHAFVLGRALYLAERGQLRLGRYKFHMMDFDFIRLTEPSPMFAYRPPSEINHSANRSDCYASLKPKPNSIWIVEQDHRAEQAVSAHPMWERSHLLDMGSHARMAMQPTAVSICHPALYLRQCENTHRLEAFLEPDLYERCLRSNKPCSD